MDPGYRKFKVVIPNDSRFSSSKLNYQSSNGLIKVNWKRVADKLMVQIHVPFNTTAQLIIKRKIKELGSGDYEFNV
ncbi:alpha-L-rhamnosidase C-terminal domain-containing protein [Companilactobacillus kimchii]|uniref:alpha-L-rhamnosidase C-terminal domain-containing protein n=1 Tax=Companilactobacillus kimchii TaxID=2801452 RepID=UPI001CEC728D